MNERRFQIVILAMNLDTAPEVVRLGLADHAIGEYVRKRDGELKTAESPIPCPYCRGVMIVKWGRTCGRVVERRGDTCILEVVPPGFLTMRCEPCQSTFTVPEGIEKPV